VLMSDRCDILLVEDSPDDIDLIERALHKADPKVKCHVLTDGEQAVSYFSAMNGNASLPSLVITDLKMPKRTGHELVEWVRRQPHLAGIPIVVLSSSDDQHDIDRAISLGANAFIVKPLGLTDLVKALQSLLASWLHRESLR
jgi:CheY-like chemotaxis protein